MNSDLNPLANNTQPIAKSGEGFLVVKVSTAKEALPLENARVTVYDNENGNVILYNLRTDSAGLTEKVGIVTEASSESQNPLNPRPYSTVNIEVVSSGYSPTRFLSVPIFDKIISVQRANMIPISENGENYIHEFNEWENYPVTPNSL